MTNSNTPALARALDDAKVEIATALARLLVEVNAAKDDRARLALIASAASGFAEAQLVAVNAAALAGRCEAIAVARSSVPDNLPDDDSVAAMRTTLREALGLIAESARQGLPTVDAMCDETAAAITQQVSQSMAGCYLRAFTALEQQLGLPHGDAH